jgi:CRP/FNR family transcriptional regulator
MNNPGEISQLIKEQYGPIFDEQLIDELTRIGVPKYLYKREVAMNYGQPIHFVSLMLSGALTILRQNDQGDELLLYFIESGDTCAVTLN